MYILRTVSPRPSMMFLALELHIGGNIEKCVNDMMIMINQTMYLEDTRVTCQSSNGISNQNNHHNSFTFVLFKQFSCTVFDWSSLFPPGGVIADK